MSATNDSRRPVIPRDLLQARLVTTAQVRELNERASERRWAAVDSEMLASRLDPVDRHCLFPMLRINASDDALCGCRCYLWFKERRSNFRTLILMDVGDSDLRRLPVIAELHLHQLVGMLLGELPLVLLSEAGEGMS